MKALRLPATKSTLEVNFEASGIMAMRGRSCTENAKQFFMPIINWCNDLQADHADLLFEMDYINTSSTKNILYVLHALDKNNKVKSVSVRWCYESDDEEMLEIGELYSTACRRLSFEFQRTDWIGIIY